MKDRSLKFGWYDELQLYMELLIEKDKLSQKEMAKKYGISEQYMSDILKNRRVIPKRVAHKMGYLAKRVFFKYHENVETNDK